MDLLVSAHASFARVIVLYLVFLGVWGIVTGLRGRGPSASYFGALVIAEVAGMFQGVFGIASFIQHPPNNTLHVLYGFALVLALPLAWTFTRGRPANRISLTLGLVALFAAGLGIRGMTTGL